MTTAELRKIPLLARLDAALLERCVAQRHIFVRDYAKTTVLHRQQDPCDALDIVLSGTLAAHTLSENGSEMMLFEFREHSVIGANLLHGGPNAYPMNIYCATDCTLAHLTRHAVLEFLRDYGFVVPYIDALSANAQGMNRKIAMLTQKTLRENLLDYLRQQAAAQGGSAIVLPISKKALADVLGVQRASLFRAFKQLKDEGVIAARNHTVTLLCDP